MTKNNNIKIFKPNDKDSLNNLFIEDGISAGFPSPASDFEESRISLNEWPLLPSGKTDLRALKSNYHE